MQWSQIKPIELNDLFNLIWSVQLESVKLQQNTDIDFQIEREKGRECVRERDIVIVSF